MSQQVESDTLLAGTDTDNHIDPIRDDYGIDPQDIPRQAPKMAFKRKSLPNRSTMHTASREATDSFELRLLKDDIQSTETGGTIWLPGIKRQFPVRGAIALFGCFAFILASIIVLVKSDGQPTSSWTISPTVYLALLVTGTNMLARFIFSEGVKITWWHTALRGGTVQDLHNRSAHADGLFSALTSGRQFNLVALASLAVTIIVIDQPLIQRASSIVTVSRTVAVNVTASIAPEIPWGFTSYRSSRSIYDQVMTQPMISAFNDYNSQAPISASSFTGCKGTCTGYVEAGGLSAQCVTATGPVWYNLGGSNFESVYPFNVNFQLMEPSDSSTPGPISLLMNIGFTNNSDRNSCRGVYTAKNCTLVASTMRYPINITGNALTIGDVLDSGMTQSFQPESIGFKTDTSEYTFWTLGGLYLAAFALFNSSATYTYEGATGIILSLPDTLSTQFIDFPAANTFVPNAPEDNQDLVIPLGCGANWTDPTSHILTALNAMAFRLSLAAASVPYRNTRNPPALQVLTMQQTENINVFKSDYRFLIGSTILTTALIVLIMPTFIGWWELGRSVTLNPIEIAKAFDAPLLQGPGSNEPLSGLMSRYGTRRVRLGEVDDLATGSANRRKLKLADPSEVGKPRAGVLYA